MSNLIEFGLYFASIREKSGFKSQRELADKSGISHSTINRIEAGTHQAGIATLKTLSKHLKNVTYDELIRKSGVLKGVGIEALIPKDSELYKLYIRTIKPEDDFSSRMPDVLEKSKIGPGVAEQTATYETDPLNDPELYLFFKDFARAPEQMKKEMLQFWNFIKDKEKNRKPGDVQGE